MNLYHYYNFAKKKKIYLSQKKDWFKMVLTIVWIDRSPKLFQTILGTVCPAEVCFFVLDRPFYNFM